MVSTATLYRRARAVSLSNDMLKLYISGGKEMIKNDQIPDDLFFTFCRAVAVYRAELKRRGVK